MRPAAEKSAGVSVPLASSPLRPHACAIQDAAEGARQIDQSTSVVAQAAMNTTDGANQTKVAANELAQLSARLNMLISQFQFEVRPA